MENNWRFRVWKPFFRKPKIVLQVRKWYRDQYGDPYYEWEDAALEDYLELPNFHKKTWRFRYFRGKLVLQVSKEQEYFYTDFSEPRTKMVTVWVDATTEDVTND